MKRIILGFSLLLSALLMALLFRDILIGGFFVPLILGVLDIGRLINSLPQLIWWIIVIGFSLSLFINSLSVPSIKILKGKRETQERGRLQYLESLVQESEKGSLYSGQLLAHLLVNLERRNRGLKEIPFQSLPSEMEKGLIPSEIAPFAEMKYNRSKKKNSPVAERLALENALKYIQQTTGGLLNE